MYIVNEEDKEYRFGDSGPKYLMKGPRMNFALVQFQAGQDFKAHYHNVMEENFYILEGEVDIVVDGVVNHLRPGQMIHIDFTPSTSKVTQFSFYICHYHCKKCKNHLAFPFFRGYKVVFLSF